MTINRADIAQVIHGVSFYLRDRHKLKRLQAEWMCFRFVGTILGMDMEGYPPIRIAERLFDLWSVCSLQREFDLLYRGVQSEIEPPTNEQRQCNPLIENNSGPFPAPTGTKGKSRRRN